MSVSAVDGSPLPSCMAGNTSDGEHETRSPVSVGSGDNERPERMRDWLIRMINSGRFIGLEWLDKEKTIFKVPWIHAKKRGYCRERDAALFREWAIHSGKYRQDSDPTVWKINFRCAINGLKDIQEIKDMQTEDCRVYKVYPSRSRRRRRTVKRTEPYPPCTTAPYTDMSSQHLYSSYVPSMNCSYAGIPCNIGAVSTSESPFSSYTSSAPNVKLEYPNAAPSHYPSNLSASRNGIYPHSSVRHPTIAIKQTQQQSSYFGDQVAPISTTKSCMAISRMDSPDSGINVEVQNSPSGMVQQSSPIHQQHSPPLYQQHSSPPSRQHSPLEQKPFASSSTGVPSPLEDITCHSPSMMDSPSPTILSEEEDSEMNKILDDLEHNPPTPPISPQVPSGELQVNVYYGSILVLSEKVDCSNNRCQIVSSKSPHSSPSSREDKAHYVSGANGFPTAPRTLVLPETHPQALSRNIFDAMGNGVVLEVDNGSVYVTPLCHTMIYCSTSPSPCQEVLHINKDQATKVFDYNGHFRPALEHYALIQGQSPNPHFFLGLGQTWGRGRHVNQNLISIMVTHCKAQYDIDTIGLPQLVAQELLMEIPDTIDVNPPNGSDLQAEAFLKNLEEINNK